MRDAKPSQTRRAPRIGARLIPRFEPAVLVLGRQVGHVGLRGCQRPCTLPVRICFIYIPYFTLAALIWCRVTCCRDPKKTAGVSGRVYHPAGLVKLLSELGLSVPGR